MYTLFIFILLAVHQRDLRFILDGNPKYLPSSNEHTRIYNFERILMLADILYDTGTLNPIQSYNYNLSKAKQIYTLFAKVNNT